MPGESKDNLNCPFTVSLLFPSHVTIITSQYWKMFILSKKLSCMNCTSSIRLLSDVSIALNIKCLFSHLCCAPKLSLLTSCPSLPLSFFFLLVLLKFYFFCEILLVPMSSDSVNASVCIISIMLLPIYAMCYCRFVVLR